MKRIFASVFCLILALLLLASCGGDEIADPSSESKLAAGSQGMSDESLHTSAASADSGDASLESAESSQPIEASIPGDASQPLEASMPEDVSQPEDVSDPDDPGDEGGEIGIYEGLTFSRPASGYKIVYTKENPVVTLACVSSFGITAQYDGKVTRFFDSVKGDFYCAYPGKYLAPCSLCGCFVAGDLKSQNHQSTIQIEVRDGAAIHEKVPHSGHGIGFAERFYVPSENKVYVYSHSENGGKLSVYNNTGAVICRSYDFQGSVSEYWNNDFGEFKAFEFDEDKFGKYGVVNNGTLVIPFEYDSIRTEMSDSLGVYACQKGGRTYYISSDGTNLTPDGFAAGSEPYQYRAWVYEDDGQGYIIEFK